MLGLGGLLDANSQAGPGPNHLPEHRGGLCQLGSNGELLRLPELVRGGTSKRTCAHPAVEPPGQELRGAGPHDAGLPAHDGGALAGLHLQRRIELEKKKRSGDSDCHCVHTCLACLKKEDDAELDFVCEAVMNRASEHNLVVLLDKWSTCWKHRGHTRALGPHASEKYCTLGFLDMVASLAFRKRLK